MKPQSKNPGYTTLKCLGRTHRDEPFHLLYPLRLYAKKGKVNATLLNDWCSCRYLASNKKSGTRWRIETYLHQDGNRYVHRVFFEKLNEEEMVELKLRFGDFVSEKMVRSGLLRRPRLTKDEKVERDAWLDKFYLDVSLRRAEILKEQNK